MRLLTGNQHERIAPVLLPAGTVCQQIDVREHLLQGQDHRRQEAPVFECVHHVQHVESVGREEVVHDLSEFSGRQVPRHRKVVERIADDGVVLSGLKTLHHQARVLVVRFDARAAGQTHLFMCHLSNGRIDLRHLDDGVRVDHFQVARERVTAAANGEGADAGAVAGDVLHEFGVYLYIIVVQARGVFQDAIAVNEVVEHEAALRDVLFQLLFGYADTKVIRLHLARRGERAARLQG